MIARIRHAFARVFGGGPGTRRSSLPPRFDVALRRAIQGLAAMEAHADPPTRMAHVGRELDFGRMED